jgi:uncharacterized membrane protein
MSNMFVLKVADESVAEQMLGTLKRLQDQRLIKVEDAAIVTRRGDGKPKIRQANDLVGAGALGGAFWGLLIGLLFFVPIFGAAIGAGAGALMGKFSDLGINDDFVKQVGNSINPGESALFLLVRDTVVDKVLPQLKQFQFQVIQTSLSHEDEQRLRETLGTVETPSA